jgi:hypothetical protein
LRLSISRWCRNGACGLHRSRASFEHFDFKSFMKKLRYKRDKAKANLGKRIQNVGERDD